MLMATNHNNCMITLYRHESVAFIKLRVMVMGIRSLRYCPRVTVIDVMVYASVDAENGDNGDNGDGDKILLFLLLLSI